MVNVNGPWPSVSPDGIIDFDNSFLEIKCSFLKNDSKLDDPFNPSKDGVVFDSGNLFIQPN